MQKWAVVQEVSPQIEEVNMLKICRYLITWPAFIGWLFPLLGLVTFVAKSPKLIGDGILVATFRPWVIKRRRWLARIKWPWGHIYNASSTPIYFEDDIPVGRSLWRFSTTISRGMLLQPDADERIIEHERVHVRQVEDLLILSFVIGLSWGLTTGQLLDALLVWVSGIAWQIPNFLGALLRGGHVYYDAEHERSAYAQTDRVVKHGGEYHSWLLFDGKRRND